MINIKKDIIVPLARIANNLRIIPRESDFLDRKVGARGEIFLDQDSQSLRVFNGVQLGGIELARSDFNNVSNAAFLAKANAAGVSGGGGGIGSVSVSAEDSTVNQVTGGVIKFNGTNGIAVTTSPTGIVNIAGPSLASTSNAGVVKVDGTTITIVNGVISATAQGAQSLSSLGFARGVVVDEFSIDRTFTDNSPSAVPTESAVRQYIDRRLGKDHDGVTVPEIDIIGQRFATEEFVTGLIGDFSDLPDAELAGLTVDRIYLPAITMLTVTNSGASAYRFDQYGTTNNPTIYAINGTTIAFNLNASGHPFLIQTPSGVNYNTGLIHVSTTGVVSTGAAAQGKDSGTLYWKIPTDISGGYRYQCGLHVSMVGSVTVKPFATL